MGSSEQNAAGPVIFERSMRRNVIAAALNLAVVLPCVYLIARVFLLTEAPYDSWSLLLGVLLLASEGFVVFHSIAYALDVASSLGRKEPPKQGIADWNQAPSVAILVPARHEPREVLDATFTCLTNLDYPNKTIYFLDDSSDEQYKREAEELAEEYGAVLFRREVRHGAKAGILNDCIKGLSEKYIAVFDSDQHPIPGFLRDVIPILEANERLAFVQTPQFYTNIDESPVAFAANLQHCIFYEHICGGKSASGAMICCGTNVVLRREALVDVGGFDERSVTEDFSTSVDFIGRGWQSFYFDRVCAFGQGPETLLPYLKQQWRWSRGNLGVLWKLLRYLVTRPFSLKLRQWWEFTGTGSYYLIGWAYFVLMLCPISYVVFGVPSFYMAPPVYLLTFVPYFSLSVVLFYTSMQRRYYRPGKLLRALMLGFTAIPIYMKAAVGALFNWTAPFKVTQKGKGATTPLRVFWPQILLWLINAVGLVWGANLLLLDFNWPVAMCMVWIFYHLFLFSGVFYFQGARDSHGEAQPA